jgi:hypothetical protein
MAAAAASIGIPLTAPGSPLPGPGAGEHFVRPGFVRQTASDRPGVAQPVPERDIPPQPWSRIFVTAIVLAALALVGWEAYWRAFGAVPGYHNGNDAWALQRARIDNGEGDATVLTGASRVLFDVQLPVWQQATGERPIQLALEGTSPVPVLEDLAADRNFTGRVLVGVAPDIFFSGFAYRGDAIADFHKRTPAQRAGTWLARHLVEPYFAFYDSDFALPAVVNRQAWPLRPGSRRSTRVRKLLVQEADRNSHMWRKLETDPRYRALARRIWAEDFGAPPPGMDTPAKARKVIDSQIDKAVAAIATLRARRAGAVPAPAEHRSVPRLRGQVLPAPADLGRAAATHRRARDPLRGLPLAAGLRAAGVVAPVGVGSDALHHRADADRAAASVGRAACVAAGDGRRGGQPRCQMRQRLLAGMAMSPASVSPASRASASTASASRMPERASRAFSQASNSRLLSLVYPPPRLNGP